MYGNPARNVWQLADAATHAGIRRTDLKVAPTELEVPFPWRHRDISTSRPPALNMWPAFISPRGGRY